MFYGRINGVSVKRLRVIISEEYLFEVMPSYWWYNWSIKHARVGQVITNQDDVIDGRNKCWYLKTCNSNSTACDKLHAKHQHTCDPVGDDNNTALSNRKRVECSNSNKHKFSKSCIVWWGANTIDCLSLSLVVYWSTERKGRGERKWGGLYHVTFPFKTTTPLCGSPCVYPSAGTVTPRLSSRLSNRLPQITGRSPLPLWALAPPLLWLPLSSLRPPTKGSIRFADSAFCPPLGSNFSWLVVGLLCWVKFSVLGFRRFGFGSGPLFLWLVFGKYLVLGSLRFRFCGVYFFFTDISNSG